MRPGRLLVVVLATLASACGVDVEVPSDLVVFCSTDSDCPAPRVCQPLIGQCVDDRDDVAPQVLSATSLDATTVVVAVTEPLADVQPDEITVSTASAGETLAVAEVTASPDGLTLTVDTVTQLPGVTYVVDLSSTVDRQGNAMDAGQATAQFRGFGGLPDTSPPDILLPAVGTRIIAGVEHRPVSLVWSARAGASAYTVDIATSQDFAQLVTSIVTDRTTVSTQFTPSAPITYFWRVRADVTAPSQYGLGRFNIIEDTFHVFCAPGADCSSSGGAEIGDRSAPFRSIARAIAAGRAEHVDNIAIASRGGEAYDDLVVPGPGMTLRGGYLADFSEATRDSVANPTTIERAGTVLTIGAAADPITLDGLRFVARLVPAIPPSAQRLTVASINGPTALITLTGCYFEAEVGADTAIGVDATTNGAGEVYITGGSSIVTGAPLSQAGGLVVQTGSTVTMDGNSTINAAGPTGGSADQGCSGVAVGIDAHFTARHVTFTASPQTLSGTVFAGGGVTDIDQATLIVPPGVQGAPVVGFGGFTEELSLTVTRSRLISAAAGAFFFDGGQLNATLANNLVLVDAGAGDAIGMQTVGSTSGHLTLIHNTVVVNGGTATALLIGGGSPIVTNNVFACSSGGIGVNEQFFLSPRITDPASFQANTILGCTTAYRNETNANLYTTALEINGLNGGDIAISTCTGCEHSRYDLNVVSSVSATTFFTDGVAVDGHVSSSASFTPSGAAAADAGGGKSTAGSDCGSIETPVSCGNLTLDFPGATRDSPPTRGAVEAP